MDLTYIFPHQGYKMLAPPTLPWQAEGSQMMVILVMYIRLPDNGGDLVQTLRSNPLIAL
jgi:hypothetical protein